MRIMRGQSRPVLLNRMDTAGALASDTDYACSGKKRWMDGDDNRSFIE